MPLLEEAHKAARILLDHAYVRILARADPDAICAAALLAHALRRENVDFHVSWTRRLDEHAALALATERPDCLVLIGLSGDADVAEVSAGRVIVLDREAPAFAAEARVHDDAALASLAHLVAAGISKRNVDLAPLALAGALASLRHVGGWNGLDAEVLREALEGGAILRESALALHGATLTDALAQLDAPYVAGITGRARNVKKLVADLKLAGDSPPGALAGEDARRLGDLLALRLLQQGAPDASLDVLFRPTLRALSGPLTGLECGELARLAEAAAASGRCGLALAALWPDAAAGGEAVGVAQAAREETVAALLRAERDARREGRLLIAEAPRAGLARPLADRLALSLAPAGTLVVVHAPDGDASFLALRGFGIDAAEVARKAAPIAGAIGGGARLFAPDASRALKAVSEVVG